MSSSPSSISVAESAAWSSMRWLVVWASWPRAQAPPGTAQAHPPGPGFPEQAPSVYTIVGAIPPGTLLVAGGMRELPTSETGPERAELRRRMAELFAGYARLHDDLRVLTGLRPGAEAVAAEAALEAEVDWIAVLPWPDPHEHMRLADRDHFVALRRLAPAEVVLERKAPATRADRAKALGRRDAWLSSVADLAVMVWDQVDDAGRDMTVRFEKAIPDDVVILSP